MFYTATAQVSCIPVFSKEYKGSGDVMPAAVRSLSDGTFIIAGKGSQGGAGLPGDGLVTRMSGNGNVIWSFLIGGPGNDAFTGVTPLNDGGFLLFGSTTSFGYTNGAAWLVRIDGAGSLLWSRQLGNGGAGPDRVKAVLQFSDGDIIGTYNANDSTAASDAVVFKMALDGTLKWAHVFDQGNNDSFTSIAFAGNVIYAAGFYTINTRRAVITTLNSANGSPIASNNVFKKDATYDHEIFNLDIFNNSISYGLWYRQSLNASYFYDNAQILVRTDMAGNILSSLYTENGSDTIISTQKRMTDNGVLVLYATRGRNYQPHVRKVNQYGRYEYVTSLSPLYFEQAKHAIDETNDGGGVFVGYYYTLSNRTYIMTMSRVNVDGEGPACFTSSGIGAFADSATRYQQSFTWASQNDYTPVINNVVAPTANVLVQTQILNCESSFCTDKTPLPPDCNKTYHLKFGAPKAVTYRDAVTTSDGGKLAIGDDRWDGMVMKYNANGDVAWAKTYNALFCTSRFVRIIQSADGNYIIFANRDFNLHTRNRTFVSAIKIDINGNVIWTRDINEWSSGKIVDVTATPNGGFVLLVSNGGSQTLALYFDGNMNVIWKKEWVGYVGISYKKVFYSNGAVYFACENPYYSRTSSFWAEKVDLATGNRGWSNIFTAGGANSSCIISRLFVNNDTSYVFLTHIVPINSFDKVNSPVMVKINPDGSLNSAKIFQADNMAYSPFFGINYDIYPLAVDLTPYNDFILSQSVVVGTDTLLCIARFGTDGTVSWAGNYAGTKNYYPLSIKAQGKGVVVWGDARDRYQPAKNWFFSNAFFIKTDSSGMINTGGGCDRTDRSFVPTPISFSVSPSQHSLQDIKAFPVFFGSITGNAMSLDATLFCNTPANCNVVTLKPGNNGCSLRDTLTYYLANNAGCDAAATWQYDTAFFKAVGLNGDSIRVVPKKTGVYTINARIEGSCMVTTQNVTSSVGLSASQISLGNDALICDRQKIKLSAGPGYASYKWNDNSTDSTLIVTQTGKYYVDVTDNCGGTGTDTVLINAAGLVFKISGNTNKCNNDAVALTASTGYTNYEWSPKVNIQATNNTAQVNPPTTMRYYATAEKWPGCTLIDSILITTLVSPPVNLPKDTTICVGDSVLLQAAPLFDSYQWNTGEQVSSIVAKTKGQFIVTATFNNGCQSKDTFMLDGYTNPVPLLNKNSVLCAGSTRQLQPSQQYAGYQWSNGSTGNAMEINSIGTYWVVVTDGHGCKGSDTARITAIAPPPAHFLPADTAMCQYGKMTIVPKNKYYAYQWSDFSNSSSLTITKPGMYWVTVTDNNNCSGSDSIQVLPKDCLEGLYVPNAFTPNRDGQNDVFRALIFGNVTSFTFVVYNRWGGRVYETHDPSLGWNGQINAQDAQKGTYVWMCRYTLEGQPEKVEKGIVELVR
ncbi:MULTISPECIES: gliding motility-associated C-terminal domain-containing protein [Niastella]|uniref:Gliding motility-associated C-terminal domain-containing protein n=1 Tax=Niastella soli TaxID=2821487 RepID=A0ABS3Z256_9BACT|nr:gliding motility-associated C-terminal domain-containing protein [Niastella soli]MBO9203847.1 gliding motility-associated C-terminal domain-containing protein [Niastella soli]